MNIKNKSELISHGQKNVRRDALKIVQSGILAGDPGRGTFKKVRLAGTILQVEDVAIDLSQVEHLYVIGAGKGAFSIANALESILGDYITEGVVVVKRGDKRRLKRIKIYEAGHPIPDKDSVLCGRKILSIAEKAGEKDVVLAAITGGSSALVVLPPNEIQLPEIQELNHLLLQSGAVIREMNTVRKHLCKLKGGQLVARIQPAHVITLTLDTQPNGMPWPDMSLADPTTFQDAIDVLKYYELEDKISPSIMAYFEDSKTRPELETIKSLEGMRTNIVSVGDPVTSCEAAAATARELGYEAVILSTNLEGEAREVAKCLAGIAMESFQYNRPFKRPCALISGGELTVTLTENFGKGGPNQEFVLGFASALRGEPEIVCAAVDTDGTDGPTEIAGGIVDGKTYSEAKELGININEYLKRHACLDALIKMNNAIITGHTGTNVLDLRVILIR